VCRPKKRNREKSTVLLTSCSLYSLLSQSYPKGLGKFLHQVGSSDIHQYYCSAPNLVQGRRSMEQQNWISALAKSSVSGSCRNPAIKLEPPLKAVSSLALSCNQIHKSSPEIATTNELYLLFSITGMYSYGGHTWSLTTAVFLQRIQRPHFF